MSLAAIRELLRKLANAQTRYFLAVDLATPEAVEDAERAHVEIKTCMAELRKLAGGRDCRWCLGHGVRSYGTTATWRGGFGGCEVTADVCDRCWGSGDEDHPGADLRSKLKPRPKET